MRILFLGDIVGAPGRKAIEHCLPGIKEANGIDLAIINGENSAAGRGITPPIAKDLFSWGADVITTGDHIWDQKDIYDYLAIEPRILRPINYPETSPGAGYVIVNHEKGKVAVVNAQGRTFMQPPLENPFLMLDELHEKLEAEGVKIIFLDFHAETTSEKIAMGRNLDGKFSVVVGTHTHVQTADEKVLPEGTAYLTDAGMCGPDDSVLGRSVESVVWRFKNSMPTRFPIASGPVRLCGCIVDIDETTGKALAIKRFNELVTEEK